MLPDDTAPIRAAETQWRQYFTDTQAQVTLKTAQDVRLMLAVGEWQAEVLHRYILEHGGIDADTGQVIREVPMSPSEYRALVAAGSLRAFIIATLVEICSSLASAPTTEAGFVAAALEGIRRARDRAPAFPGRIAALAADEDVRRDALASLTGWVATKTNLGKNRRLHDALARLNPESPHEALLDLLPSATVEAWHDAADDPGLPHAANLEDFLTRAREQVQESEVRSKLEVFASDTTGPDDYQQQPGDLMPDRDPLGDPETVLLLGEAERAVRELVAGAGLTPSEAEIVSLCREGYTEREIADKRRVHVGTIKTLKSRAVKKLRAHASERALGS